MRGRVWRIGLAVAVALAAGAAGPSRAAEGPRTAEALRVAVAPWDGFGFQEADGRLAGFDVDMARALCEEIAARCDIRLVPFGTIIERLRGGQDIDIAVTGVLRTPERERMFLFTDRYWRSSSSFVARAGRLSGVTPKDLAGARIAVDRGTRQHAYIRDQIGGGVTIVECASSDDTIAAVARGDADVALLPTIAALINLSKDRAHGLEVVGDPITSHGLGGDVGIALPFGRDALRNRVNQALRTLLLNGRYDAISSRYFPFRLY